MGNVSLLPVSLAGVLSGAGAMDEQAVISTYVLPEIAGLWELDLSQVPQNQVGFNDTGSEADAVLSNVLELNNPPHLNADLANASSPCRERYNFARDNVVTTVSGDEWTYGKFVYQHQPDGLPILFINTVYDNNNVDCSGSQIDQTGETLEVYVAYDVDNHHMQWCMDAEGKECAMQFNRLLP